MNDDLTAAVKRLRQMLPLCDTRQWQEDVRLVLSALEAAQAAMPPREATLHMEPIAWMVGEDASTAAVYNAGEREQAFDAARRWNKCISGLVWSYNTPNLPNSQQTSGPGVPCESPRSGVSATTSAADGNVGTEDATSGTGRIGRTAPGPLDHQPCIERGCPNPSLMPESEYCAYHARREPQQSAATPSQDPVPGAAQAVTDGPAADPIADLCARLRGYNPPDRTIDAQRQMAQDIAEAADALERLARERDDTRAMLRNTNHDAARLASLVDKYKWQVRDTCARAERAEAERDTLLAIVRAADELREWLHPDRDSPDKLIWVCQDYDAARAAWKGEV